MKRKNKALLLSSLVSLAILVGCGKESETLTIGDEVYIQEGEEYKKLDLSSKVFEPGTHVIHYIDAPNNGYNIKFKQVNIGYENNSFVSPIVPEGYRLVGFSTLSTNDGYDWALVYVFTNEKTVEVIPNYNTITGQIEYENPGKVIEEKVLTMNGE